MIWITISMAIFFPYIPVHARYTWTCEIGVCVKSVSEIDSYQSLETCQFVCDPYSSLWPRPTGEFRMSPILIPVSVNVSVEHTVPKKYDRLARLVEEAGTIFRERVKSEAESMSTKPLAQSNHTLLVLVEISDLMSTSLTLETDESYELMVFLEKGCEVRAVIAAQTFFGARHGLETLTQLVLYNETYATIVVPAYVYISDAPFYAYRGVLLDTSRNYFSVESIKRTIDAMAWNKLNTFHWHITDSHSFPFESQKYPEFSHYGALAPNKIYTHADVRSVVEHARARGVRVMPELDQPAHAAEGWQWAADALACFDALPWSEFCPQPPCGQLDPTTPQVYDLLQGLYQEFNALFDSDLFHMGGDEINVKCWNESSKIILWMLENGYNTTTDDFGRLWKYFQDRSAERLFETYGRDNVSVVLWSNAILGAVNDTEIQFDTDKYIIQLWTYSDNPMVLKTLSQGHRIIFSNCDALYLDCGFGNWLDSQPNWCTPYKTWQRIYANDPLWLVAKHQLDARDSQVARLVLGAEATLFTEMVDEASLDGRLWPRASALAERLWSRPARADASQKARGRLFEQRARLVRRGVLAEAVHPEWCRQNQRRCPAEVFDVDEEGLQHETDYVTQALPEPLTPAGLTRHDTPG